MWTKNMNEKLDSLPVEEESIAHNETFLSCRGVIKRNNKNCITSVHIIQIPHAS